MKSTGYFILLLMIMMGCSEKMNLEYVDKDNDIKMIKAEAIEAFKRKKIFFFTIYNFFNKNYHLINF